MQVHVITDNHIHATDNHREEIAQGLRGAFERFAQQITRIDVHLADVNGPKGGSNDIRCLVEVRVAHREPVATSHQAASIDEAVDGATDKAFRVIETTLERLHDLKGPQTSAGGAQVI
jgi:ribosome-associated translation inhibitor RaiA